MRAISAEVGTFLGDHITDLLKRADRGSSAPATFRRPEAEERFKELQSAPEAEFLKAAQQLTDDLYTAMDQRAKSGFVVAIRERTETGALRAAILKLDVHEESAAVAREVDEEHSLEAVKDLLDLPGQLQKGAVYPDPRPDSQVVVGDKVTEATALYFLRAIEVQQTARVRDAPRLLIRQIQSVAPDRVNEVAAALDTYDRSITPAELFDEHPELLDPAHREDVLHRLEQQQRPVRELDLGASRPEAVVSADGIRVYGAVAEINRRVSWGLRQGQWVIEIEASEEPRKTYR